MHVITRCQYCARQYDTEGHQPGEQFHCICGRLLEVPAVREFEASVVRCASCGGTRENQDLRCAHCGADFTLLEQDLNTVCPACMARISDQASYCHHCAIPITVAGTAGEFTDKHCPGCSEERFLSSRIIKDTLLNALECNVCTGIWLDQPVFLELERRMIELAGSGLAGAGKPEVKNLSQQKYDDQNFYRKCPECMVLMHRRNYGPGSGIVIDQCHQHGFWFDGQELNVLLRWIRTGGLLATRKRREKIRKENDRVKAMLEKMEDYNDRFKGGKNWQNYV